MEHGASEDTTDHLIDNSEGETAEITREEVVKAVQRLKKGQSPGEMRLLQRCSNQGKLLLNGSLTSYKKCGEQGGFQWNGSDQC